MVGQGKLCFITCDLFASTYTTTDEKRRPTALNLAPTRSDTSDSSSSTNSLKPPRTPRFAEDTAVHSPTENHSPFTDPDQDQIRVQHVNAAPGDVGFGYIGNNTDCSSNMAPKSPLKSAMKVPGTPARNFSNPLSPTFRQEDILEKRELHTDKEQVRDLVSGFEIPYIATQLGPFFPSNENIENQNPSSHGQVCPSRSQL